MTTTYDRPVAAKLIVRLDNGDEWEAMAEDMERFGYRDRLAVYARTERMLAEACGYDGAIPGDSLANDVRYLIECAINYDHSPWADENGQEWEGEDSGLELRDRIRTALAKDEP